MIGQAGFDRLQIEPQLAVAVHFPQIGAGFDRIFGHQLGEGVRRRVRQRAGVPVRARGNPVFRRSYSECALWNEARAAVRGTADLELGLLGWTVGDRSHGRIRGCWLYCL